MQRKYTPQPDDSAMLQEAVQRLIEQAEVAFNAQSWNQVTVSHQELLGLLHQRRATITHSALAELHARWGLAYAASRVPEQAVHHLRLAEQLVNQEYAEATHLADSQQVTLAGEGDTMNLPLIHDALATLADLAVRRAEPATDTLRQVVSVADMVDEPQARWQARQRLTDYLAAQRDWPALTEAAAEWVALARERRELPLLLEALRPLSDGLIGQRNSDRAIEAQALLVEVARTLGDDALAQEEKELERMHLSASIR